MQLLNFRHDFRVGLRAIARWTRLFRPAGDRSDRSARHEGIPSPCEALPAGWLFQWVKTCAMVVLCVAANAVHAAPDKTPALAWDATEKRYEAKPGEAEAEFFFTVKNISDKPVEITDVATSCHCTAAMVPRKPWILAPQAEEELRVVVDLRSRRGSLTKTIYVDSSAGPEQLRVFVQVPPPPEIQREMNQMVAQADRQAVLRGDCASCHVKPTVGKKGAELFVAACLICHGGEHRASMVPDLMQPKSERDAAFWDHWIRQGGAEGTLMPAFAKSAGGPLDDEQIKSLVEYLVANLPTHPVAP